MYTSHNVFPLMKDGIHYYMLHDFKWFSNERLSSLHPSHILFLYTYEIRKKERRERNISLKHQSVCSTLVWATHRVKKLFT